MRSYGRRNCSTRTGRLVPELAELAPAGQRRMGANPHANGGLLLRDLELPDFRDYAVTVPQPGAVDGRGHPRAGTVRARRDQAQNPRELPRLRPGRDDVEPAGARCSRSTNRRWTAEILPTDEHVAPDGRVMEMLSEHSARDGSKAICSPAGTACSPATRRSSTSSIRCSTSTPNG